VVAALVPAAAGAALDRRRWLNGWFVAGVLLWVAVAVAAVAQSYDAGVSDADLVEGILLAALGIGALPFAAYYALARWLWRRQPIVLAIAFVVSLAPFAYYLFVAVLIAVGFLGCPPDSYECPI
jgi:hypothetical protein